MDKDTKAILSALFVGFLTGFTTLLIIKNLFLVDKTSFRFFGKTDDDFQPAKMADVDVDEEEPLKVG